MANKEALCYRAAQLRASRPLKLSTLEQVGFGASPQTPKRAVTATVRGLAVTMMALLKHPEREYVPLSGTNQKLLERLAEERKAMEGHSEAVEMREAAER